MMMTMTMMMIRMMMSAVAEWLACCTLDPRVYAWETCLAPIPSFLPGAFCLQLAAFSHCQGGYMYVTFSNLPALRQPQSVFGAFVYAGTICLFLDP